MTRWIQNRKPEAGACLPRRVAMLLGLLASGLMSDLPAQSADEGAQTKPEWIFFPTPPPPVGVGVASQPAGDGPAVLRNFVDEPFYAPLSARLVHLPQEEPDPRPFTREQLITFEGFIEMRDALRAELRRTLDHVSGLDAGLRLRELEAFATRQTPRLVALEAVAEKFRAGLARRDPWDELRSWRLGRGTLNRPRSDLAVLELEVVRAAAYYQEGLSPAQRRLLREHAAEQGESILAPAGTTSVARLFFYFSPEGARLPRPVDLSGEVDGLLARYEGDKARLKSELADAVFHAERFLLSSTRRRAMEELAGQQAPRIQELEEQADKIRRVLASLPGYVRRDPLPPVPVAIEEEIESFARDFADAVRDRDAKVAGAVEVEVETTLAGRADAGAVRRAMHAARSRYYIDNFERMREFDDRAEKIRDSIETALPEAEVGVYESDPVRFLGAFLDFRAKQQAWYEYEIAALEPGLSPEQRRLLFGAVLQDLRLPIPGPVPQPTRLGEIVVPELR